FFTVALNPAGEGGCPLNNGTIVLCKDDNSRAAMYDAQFNLLAELTDVGATGSGTASSNLVDTFAVAAWPLGHVARLVNAAGVVSPTLYDPGSSSNLQALGLNTDASTFYYAAG